MSPRRSALPLAGWLVLCLLALGCGQILTRATPTPRAGFSFLLTPAVTATGGPPATPAALPSIAAQPTFTPTPAPPAPTVTPVPLPASNLSIGAPARVVFGVNVREAPSVNARRLGQFVVGQVVTVEAGPTLADNFRWWRVVDKAGLRGWAADGGNGATWLDANVGEPRLVARPVVLGDIVEVTAQPQMSIRFQPGTDGDLARRASAGERFTVRDGPRDVDGLRWWFVVDQQGREYWAAEARGTERWLTAVE